MMTKRLLFIHRSCGANLLRQGHVREQLAGKHADLLLDDYNQNKSTLTDNNGNQSFFKIDFVGNDTTPAAYAQFFHEANKEDTMLQRILKEYDTAIIKSCYPNNAIASDEALDELKAHYESMISFFIKNTDKQLGIVTTPPLLAAKTNQHEAKRARELANWLASSDFGKRVSIFDFYGLLADPSTNTLRREYRRLWAKSGIPDSHPNRKANQIVASHFVEWVAKFE